MSVEEVLARMVELLEQWCTRHLLESKGLAGVVYGLRYDLRGVHASSDQGDTSHLGSRSWYSRYLYSVSTGNSKKFIYTTMSSSPWHFLSTYRM